MRKKFLLKPLVLLCALIVGSSSLWADDTYTRITSTTDLKVGEKYIIVYGSKNVAMGTIGSNGKGQGVSVSISNNSINLTSTSNVNVFTLGGDATNGYTLLGSQDNMYIGYKSSTNFEANASASTNKYKWTISFSSSSNNATIKNVGDNSRFIKGYTNSDNNTSDFRAYTSSNGDAVQLYKLVYVITPDVNNATMGSATVSGNTITATPNAGYRVKSGDEGYTVTEGTATVVNNGNNTFTVTPTSNCTVQINFEALPSHTLNTVVTPNAAGTVTLGSTSVIEGTTTTATAVANAGFKFVNWSIEGTGASLSSNTDNPITVTMGSSDATITAIFTTATTFAISYSVNGKIVEIKNVEENTPIDLSAPTSGVPSGFVFQGWVNEPFTGTQSTAPTYVTPTNATSDVTYYAVMAMLLEEGDDTYEKLDNQSFDANATYVIGAEQASTNNTMWYLYSYSKVDANSSWGVMTSNPASIAPITFTLSGTASALVAMDNSGNYLKGLTTGNFHMSSTSTTIAINESGAIQNATNNNYKLRHNYNNGAGGLRWYSGDTGTQAYFYKVVPGNVYGNYCTTVTNTFTTEGSWNDAANWSLGIVPAEGYSVTIDAACEIPASCIAQVNTITIGGTGSLTIADGGQLICNNNPTVTVQKTVAQHGATTADGGWNFIASPIDGTVDPALAGLITDNEGYQATATTATYDLYRFVQNPVLEEGEGYEWKNYRKNNFLLSNGAGYLYASKNGVTLNFVGNVVPNTADGLAVPLVYAEESATTDMTLRGWNLVGNPFTFNAAVDMAYYTLDANRTVIPNTTTQAIVPPCTGIMVYVNETGQSITFSKPLEGSAPSNGNVNIAVMQANERGASATTVDKAIVSFNEGNELPKFYFGNANANLYIPQGEKEYAIATSDGQGEMPLNFRANADGQYTLTVNPEGVEMNYLHLIDNMTGNDIDLLQTPSYSFNAKTTDYESRFRLVFAANNESGVSASSTTFAFYSNGNWMVNNEGEATLQIIDVMGRVLSNQTISGTAELNLNQQPGVFVLRLVNGNDVKTQKIVVR